MAIIFCPECSKKISDKAESCPDCGYPLKSKTEERIIQIASINSSLNNDDYAKPEKMGYWKKLFIIIGFSIIAISIISLLIYGLVEKNRKDAMFVMHNTRTGFDVKLGMSKDQLDKLLGMPIHSDIYDVYLDHGLLVIFAEGHATMLTVSSSDWQFMNFSRVDDSTRRLVDMYGKPTADDALVLMIDSNGRITPTKKETAIYLIINEEYGRISSMSIVGGP